MNKLSATLLLLSSLTITSPAHAGGFWSDLYNSLIAYSVPFDSLYHPNPSIVNH